MIGESNSLFRRSQNPHFQNEANSKSCHNHENEFDLHESFNLFNFKMTSYLINVALCSPLKIRMEQRIN